jgi:hypothetical protein
MASPRYEEMSNHHSASVVNSVKGPGTQLLNGVGRIATTVLTGGIVATMINKMVGAFRGPEEPQKRKSRFPGLNC